MLSLASSSKYDASDGGTGVPLDAPSGVSVGDFVVVVVHGNGQITISDNNGSTPFTKVLSDYKPNPNNGHTISIFARTIQAGDPSTYNFTLSSGGRRAGVAMRFTDSISPSFDVAPDTGNAVSADNSDSGDITIPSITTLVDNAIHVLVAGWDTSSIGSISTPSGYTLIENANGGGEPLHTSYKVISTAGATGSSDVSNTEFGARIGISFSVKGAGSAPPTGFQFFLDF